MPQYIYSTLANDMTYVDYHESPGNAKSASRAVPKHSVLIAGKVGVANKNLITPRGAVTKVTDEDFEMLSKNGSFLDHVKNGYITHEKKSAEIDRVVVNMVPRDVSAPITPDFYKKAQQEEPVDGVYTTAVPKGVRRRKG